MLQNGSGFLKNLFQMLKSPDRFEDDAYGWVTNQVSHATIIGQVAGVALVLLGMDEIYAVTIVGVVYFILWEICVQRSVRCKDLRADSLIDTLHVSIGAAMGILLLAGNILALFVVFVIWLALLAYGICIRQPK